MAAPAALYIGLMSGTSIDSIDAVIVQCETNYSELVATHEHPIPAQLRDDIAAISHPGENEIERMGMLDRGLGALFADAALELLRKADKNAADITAIGSHGQTVRHRPPSAGASGLAGFTLQIGDPNTIAERTGITTVADFRRRDIAANGEGAPLAPAFHQANFAKAGVNRAIVNIGGIANVTLLQGETLIGGFDSGPGNTLMDHWVRQCLDQPYDDSGKWAASGTRNNQLLDRLLQLPYFDKTGPRSTGKELFNMAWIENVLGEFPALSSADVQATLLELTAASIANSVNNDALDVSQVYVCGGGAHNLQLLERLRANLLSGEVTTTAELGLHPDWVEAATFAWLAHRTLSGLAGNAPAVTGASGFRVLGGIYPAGAACT